MKCHHIFDHENRNECIVSREWLCIIHDNSGDSGDDINGVYN